jgi:integrase
MRWQRGSVTIEGARGLRRFVGRYRRDDGTQPKIVLGFVSEMTLSEARTKLEAKVRELGSRPQSSLEMTFSDYWSLHYEPRRRVRWSEATATGYAAYLKHYLTPAFGNVRLSDMTPEQITTFFEQVRQKHSRSVVTKLWTLLHAVLDDATDDDVISKNPMRRVEYPKTKLPAKPVLEAVFLRKVLKAAKLDAFASALLHVGVFCALRTSEALGLRWRSFTGDRLTIRDVAWHGKLFSDTAKVGERSVYVPPATRAALERWRKLAKFTSNDDLIFASKKGTPLSAHNVRNRVLEPLREKLKLDAPLTFQVLRRSFATRSQEHTKSLQSHLGHMNVSTTLGIYAQAIDASVRQMVVADEKAILSATKAIAP